MKKILAIFFLTATLVVGYSQTLIWKTFPTTSKKELISNIVFLKNYGVELFDYQGAVFEEYKPEQKILLHVVIFQVNKAEDGSGYLYSCTDRRNADNYIIIEVDERVKDLNTNMAAFFLCSFDYVWPLTMTNRETGAARTVKVPFFYATQAWTLLDMGE